MGLDFSCRVCNSLTTCPSRFSKRRFSSERIDSSTFFSNSWTSPKEIKLVSLLVCDLLRTEEGSVASS